MCGCQLLSPVWFYSSNDVIHTNKQTILETLSIQLHFTQLKKSAFHYKRYCAVVHLSHAGGIPVESDSNGRAILTNADLNFTLVRSLIQVGNSFVADPPTLHNNNSHTQAMQFSPASDLRRLLRQGDNTSYHVRVPLLCGQCFILCKQIMHPAR